MDGDGGREEHAAVTPGATGEQGEPGAPEESGLGEWLSHSERDPTAVDADKRMAALFARAAREGTVVEAEPKPAAERKAEPKTKSKAKPKAAPARDVVDRWLAESDEEPGREATASSLPSAMPSAVAAGTEEPRQSLSDEHAPGLSLGRHRHRHRHRRTAVVVGGALAVVLVAVLIGVTTSSTPTSGPGVASRQAVATALAATQHAGTADVTMSLAIGGGGAGLTESGQGAVDLASGSSDLSLSYSTAGQQLSETVIDVGPTAYVNLGSIVSLVVPGKTWIAVDLGQDQAGASGVGAGGFFADPTALLALLRAPGVTIGTLGASTLDGHAVEGYSVQFGSSRISALGASRHLPAFVRDELALAHYTHITYDLYVDQSDHRLAAVRADAAYTVAGQPTQVGSTVVFTDYGTPVSVAVPPAGEVVPVQQYDRLASQR